MTPSDDAGTDPTEVTDGEAVIAPACLPSIELHHDQATGLAEDKFTFDQTPAQNSAGPTTNGDAPMLALNQPINDLAVTAAGVVAEPSLVEHESHGDSETISVTVSDEKDQSAATDHSKNDHSNSKDHSELKGDSGSTGLGDTFHFKDKMPDPKHSDVGDLAGADHTPASIDHHGNAAGHHESMTMSETPAIEPSLPGHSDHHSNVVPGHAHVQHDLIV